MLLRRSCRPRGALRGRACPTVRSTPAGNLIELAAAPWGKLALHGGRTSSLDHLPFTKGASDAEGSGVCPHPNPLPQREGIPSLRLRQITTSDLARRPLIRNCFPHTLASRCVDPVRPDFLVPLPVYPHCRRCALQHRFHHEARLERGAGSNRLNAFFVFKRALLVVIGQSPAWFNAQKRTAVGPQRHVRDAAEIDRN